MNATSSYDEGRGNSPAVGTPISSIDYTGYVFVPLFFITGVIGNSLTIRVMLTKSFRSMPVAKTLIALSLSDTGVNLLFPFNKPFIKALLGIDIRAFSSGGCKLFFWGYRFFKITSSWMVVAICCERFVAVWLPLKAKKLNTTRHTYIVIACIYGVLAAFIGYWCSWADRIIDGRCIVNSRPLDRATESQVFLIFGVLLYGYIPSTIILVLSCMIIYKLAVIRKAKQKTFPTPNSLNVPQNTNKPHKGTDTTKTTVMLLAVAVSFLILVTPNSTAHLVSFAKRQNIFETTEPGMVFFREISQIMEQANNSNNFILYILLSKKFRDRVLYMFTRNKTRPSGLPGSTQETSTTNLPSTSNVKSSSHGRKEAEQCASKPTPAAEGTYIIHLRSSGNTEKSREPTTTKSSSGETGEDTLNREASGTETNI